MSRLSLMIVDGKKIAEEVIAALTKERSHLPPVVRLGVLMSAGDKATESFVKMKERVADRLRVVVVREMLDEKSSTTEALRALERLVKTCEGVIVQLPLSPHISTEEILQHIPPGKDADALGPGPFVVAPVTVAVQEILMREAKLRADDMSGKKAVVVGEGRLVGKPVAGMLKKLGTEVTVVSLERGDLSELKDADIVISGAGSPHLIKPEMLKSGVVLIDAGTAESNGKVAGDCDPACASVASLFTPVPGGVGPIAVAVLFKNLFTLAKK